MHFVSAKGILSAHNGMNLYRGCTHGCIYCDSRSACYHIDHDFEDIEVKRNAPILLEDALRRKRKRCMISTGAMVKTGKVYENLMINLRPTNIKLKGRMLRIVDAILDCGEAEAERLLEKNDWNIRKAGSR